MSGFNMMDLFRSEVETHAAILTSGLLDLENNPGDMQVVDGLMRAAHSIKGGARIVDMDDVVRIAHSLEDCFQEIKKTGRRLKPDNIDVLLSAVDRLTAISAAGDAAPEKEDTSVAAHLEAVAAVTASSPPEPAAETAPPASPAPPSPESPLLSSEPPVSASRPAAPPARPDAKQVAASPRIAAANAGEPGDMMAPEAAKPVLSGHGTQPKAADGDRFIRVAADKIERLMGLAGEVVVGASWYPSFAESLIRLKRSHVDLANTMDNLQKYLEKSRGGDAVRHLSRSAGEIVKRCNDDLVRQIDELDKITSQFTSLSDRLYAEMIGVRMCAFGDGLHAFPRMIRDLGRETGKKVRLETRGERTEVDRDILEKLDAPLHHLLRNAVVHGVESPEKRAAAGKPEIATIRLEALHQAGMLIIRVSDDGQGVDMEILKEKIQHERLRNPEMVAAMTDAELLEFIFLPGFTTRGDVTEIAGRGVGLDVVHNVVHEVGGVVRAASLPGQGMTFIMELPLTLSVIRTFIVDIAGELYAFPLARIDRCIRVKASEIRVSEDRQYMRHDETNVALVNIHEVLELPEVPASGDALNVVLVSGRHHSYALVVDDFVGECELVVRPLDPRLGQLADISAAAITLDGSPVLIFDVEDLLHSIVNLLEGKGRLNKIESGEADGGVPPAKRILVVEDSFIVREKERKLLESRGYEVETAVDGMDGWNLLRTLPFDLVVSDIDMPRMNGIELIRNIKSHEELKNLPVIIVSYKSREEDRVMGLEAGADYYLPKTDFNDNSLIDAAVDLIGQA
ncbi:MAG: hybrid sensor histidine kinase/response regulator [Desulfobacterales bacterium]|nr:MAG: hybrid sensor histidine kinase/response regulator [Desulfobacterales bacterium]